MSEVQDQTGSQVINMELQKSPLDDEIQLEQPSGLIEQRSSIHPSTRKKQNYNQQPRMVIEYSSTSLKQSLLNSEMLSNHVSAHGSSQGPLQLNTNVSIPGRSNISEQANDQQEEIIYQQPNQRALGNAGFQDEYQRNNYEANQQEQQSQGKTDDLIQNQLSQSLMDRSGDGSSNLLQYYPPILQQQFQFDDIQFQLLVSFSPQNNGHESQTQIFLMEEEVQPQAALKSKKQQTRQTILQDNKNRQNPQSAIKTQEHYCPEHHLQYHYYQNTKETKFCNQCLSVHLLNQPEQHQIFCLCSGLKIQSKMQINQRFKQEQGQCRLYFCQSCTKDTRERYEQLCLLHFLPKASLCTQLQCIDKGINYICKSCQEDHIDHRVIDFNKQSLLKQFDIKNKERETPLTLNKAKQNLQFNELHKLKALKHINEQYEFIIVNSISNYNLKEVQKNINQLLQKKGKHQLLFLTAIRLNNQKWSKDQQVLNFSQYISDGIAKIHEKLLDEMSFIILNASNKIKRLFEADVQQIKQYTSQKNEIIRHKETNGQFQNTHPQFECMAEQNTKLVKVFDYSKYSQEDQLIKIQKESKVKRQKFYKQFIPQILYNYSQKASSDVNNLINKTYFRNLADAFEKADVEDKIKKSIISKIQEIDRQQQKIGKSCTIFQKIKDCSFTNLKIIQINYQQQQYLREQQSSIQATELFKVVHQQTCLEKITVKGVFIQNLEIFFRKYYQSKMGKQILNQKKGLNKQKDQYWIRQFHTNAKISLSAQIKFVTSNFDVSVHQFLHFFTKIGVVNNLKIILSLSEKIYLYHQPTLQSLLSALQKIKQLRVRLQSCRYSQQEKPQIFMRLSQFTNITQLQLQYIYFENQDTQKYFSEILAQLSVIEFSNCQLNFMLPLQCKAKAIAVHKTKFNRKQEKSLIEYICEQKQLQKLKMIEMPKDFNTSLSLQKLIYLQHLQIRNCNWFDDKFLSTLCKRTCRQLQYLSLEYSGNMKVDLISVLQKLENISYLKLTRVLFEGKHLLTIPSKILQVLILEFCEIASSWLFSEIHTKWRQLRQLKIRQSKNQLKGDIITHCIFHGMTKITVSQMLLDQGTNKLRRLQRKGIKVKLQDPISKQQLQSEI